MKLARGVHYKKLSNKHECCENRHSHGHSLLQCVNEILLTFLHFSPALDNIHNRRYPQKFTLCLWVTQKSGQWKPYYT